MYVSRTGFSLDLLIRGINSYLFPTQQFDEKSCLPNFFYKFLKKYISKATFHVRVKYSCFTTMLEKQRDFARVFIYHEEYFFLFSFSAYLILPSISFDILTWRKISNFFKTTIEDATLNTMKIICWVMFEKK